MLYHHLFKKHNLGRDVIAGVIGAGHFGTAIVTQQNYTDYVRIPVVADIDLQAAKLALLRAGITESQIQYSNDPKQAQEMLVDGKYIYTDNAAMLAKIPVIDVICEGTGVPEVSAELCWDAIQNNKHVIAISKEMDSVIGPILKKKAKEKGIVYSPVDGDQPALLMAMVEWARVIGLTVVSAGKARDGEFVYDENKQTVSIAADGITVHEDAFVHVPDAYRKYFEMIPEGPGQAEKYIAKRKEILQFLPSAGAFDLCEMVMVANAVGMKPAHKNMTDAPLRITELPVAYCSKKNNGIYEQEGVIDVHTNFRRADESGMGGGVYMVVRFDNEYSNYILTTKGQIHNYDSSTAVIYRPYHLCGTEVTTSILSAALLGLDTGTKEYKPIYDLVKTAKVDINAGEKLGNDHDLRLTASIVPATKLNLNHAVPAHMITGNKAVRDIKAGSIITYDMIEDKSHTLLWKLRKEQEETVF